MVSTSSPVKDKTRAVTVVENEESLKTPMLVLSLEVTLIPPFVARELPLIDSG
jgi:hypothetical protein